MAKVWHQCTAAGEGPDLREHLGGLELSCWNIKNVYYNAWIWQLLWFKFCCCICLYITYIIYNTSCPLMWHVSSQHHQTSTTKLVMLLNKYFAWFAIYPRRTIWTEGWDHRKTTHDSIHYSSTIKSCMTPNKTLSLVSLSTIRAFYINICFCLSLFIFSYFGKGLPSRSCVKL